MPDGNSRKPAILAGFRCKIDDWYGLHRGFTLNLRPGCTAVVGPNGAGKTTLLNQVEEKARAKSYRTFRYANLSDGGDAAMQLRLFRGDISGLARSACSSEGQNVALNIGDAAQSISGLVRETKADGKPLFVFLDGVDSGLSIDLLLDVENLFRTIERDAGVSPGGADHPVYVLAAVNQYELAKGRCIDARTGKPVSFADYGDYARFITGYFDRPEHAAATERK